MAQSISDILGMILSPGYAAARGFQALQNRGNANGNGGQNPAMGGNTAGDIGVQNIPNDGSTLWGRPDQLLTFNKLTPGQQQGSQFALNKGMQGLNSNQFDFAPIEQQARANYSQQGIPSILERFSGLGAQRSSALGQTLAAGQSGLERDLSAQKQNYNLEQQSGLRDLLRLGLQPQISSHFSPREAGAVENIGSSFLENLPEILKFLALLS